MTFQEFRAWLEGFEEAFVDGRPTTEQWAKVKAKLADVGPAQRSTEQAPDLRKPFIQPWSEPRVRFHQHGDRPTLQPTVYGMGESQVAGTQRPLPEGHVAGELLPSDLDAIERAEAKQ